MYIQDLLEQWMGCQRTWLYLEPIFGAEDIVRQMPSEAKRFQAAGPSIIDSDKREASSQP